MQSLRRLIISSAAPVLIGLVNHTHTRRPLLLATHTLLYRSELGFSFSLTFPAIVSDLALREVFIAGGEPIISNDNFAKLESASCLAAK